MAGCRPVNAAAWPCSSALRPMPAAACGVCHQSGHRRTRDGQPVCYPFPAIFAQVSRNVMVRLNTGRPVVLSFLSTQK